MSKIQVTFTGTARQIHVPAHPMARNILEISGDHHVAPANALTHYPEMFTGHDSSMVHPHHGLMYQAEALPDPLMPTMETLDWSLLLSVLSLTFCGVNRSLSLRYPENFRGNVPLWPIISMSSMVPTLFSPDATRFLASDFRSLGGGRGHWERLREDLSTSAATNHVDVITILREGILSSARLGGIVTFKQASA